MTATGSQVAARPKTIAVVIGLRRGLGSFAVACRLREGFVGRMLSKPFNCDGPRPRIGSPVLASSFLHAWLSHSLSGILAYVLTSAPVWLGVLFGIHCVVPGDGQPATQQPDFLTACSRYDGIHYTQIVEQGYSYDHRHRSTVAFFPAYPLIARQALILTGFSPRTTLLVVSNIMLLGAFIAFSAYLGSRSPPLPASERLLVLALFGLCPAGFFFRMTYSESTFLLFTLCALLGMVRSWPPLLVAVLAGFATAARPVGVAVAAAFLQHLMCDPLRGSIGRRLLLALACLPVACWGLFAYMAYQYVSFGSSVAFAQAQEHWGFVSSAYGDFRNKITALLAAEPIWSVYTPDPTRNWRVLDSQDIVIFNIFFWNPLFFVVALALLYLGIYTSWLTGPEFALGIGLLAIPYMTRAYEMSMASHARFVAVVLPSYIVFGRVLKLLPEWATWFALGLLSLMLMAWSALFAAGRPMF